MTNIDKTMNTNDEDEIVTQENDTEETENDEQEHYEKPDENDEVSELRKKLLTAESQKDHWRKKAQSNNNTPMDSTAKSELSSKDLLSVMRANVHDDDLDEVIEFAKFKRISVSEAMNNDVVKTILSNNAEFRKTANTANTANARKGTQKVSGDTLTANLSKGQVPDTNEESEALFWARRGGKRG